MTKPLFQLAVSLFLLVASIGAPLSAQTPAPAPAIALGNSSDGIARSLIIRRSGSYYLPRDLVATEEVGIDIRASDVTLDLSGHTLLGPGERSGVGIKAEGVSNVRILNGNLQDFGIGVQILGAANVSVSGLQIDGQDLGGSPPEVEIGVLIVNSRGVRVADNTISDTFLGVFVRGDGSSGNRITGNLIAGGDNGELAICYNPAPGADGGGPSGDLITNNFASRYRRGFSFSADSVGNILRDNSFAYFDLGVVEATAGSNVIADNDEVQIAR